MSLRRWIEPIVPYEGRLAHADDMVAKVESFVLGQIDRDRGVDT